MPEVTAEALIEIVGPRTRVVRYANIHNADGSMWMERAALIDGTVTVDETAAERRIVDLTLANDDGALAINPLGGLWYDKIIKPFRGVLLPDGTEEVWPLGGFMIDQIEEQDFPSSIHITGRDRTKQCQKSKFALPTIFASGQILEVLVKNIAANAGITDIVFPVTGIVTTREFAFDAETTRWDAMKTLVDSFGYELFFTANEYLVMRRITDPTLDPIMWSYETGSLSTVISWKRRTKDDRLYNVVHVTGESVNGPIVWAESRNEVPGSATNVERIGERLYPYKSAFIVTTEQAQDLADRLLAVMSLESWEIDMETLVFPWFEAGNVIEFTDDAESTRWRLSNFNIPLSLSPMPVSGRRLEIVT